MATFLVTGGAGFIGSNIARTLIRLGHSVRVLDDLFSGFERNLDDIRSQIDFINGSILTSTVLADAMDGVDYCLHLAAIPSVPRSIKNPVASNQANVEGTIRVLLAAGDAGVKRVVCSSSSSVYGRTTQFPTTEESPLSPISPYAVSKMAAEKYGEVLFDSSEMDVVYLRYFNVFGPYQNPDSEYSAVIPKFIRRLMTGEKPIIHGDGSQSRDFTFVDNVVNANIMACESKNSLNGSYNIACGNVTSVLEIATILSELLGRDSLFDFETSRADDVPKSWASIEKARADFGYEPKISLREGLKLTVDWYTKESS